MIIKLIKKKQIVLVKSINIKVASQAFRVKEERERAEKSSEWLQIKGRTGRLCSLLRRIHLAADWFVRTEGM